MSYLWEANHVNKFWIFVQGNYKSWKLGKIMKHSNFRTSYYTQPIEWFYQAKKHIAYEWNLTKT